jgi:hypothetical protein
VCTATARLAVSFIEEKNRNKKDKFKSRYPPVYKIKVQKTIGKNVALSTCGIFRKIKSLVLLCAFLSKTKLFIFKLILYPTYLY